MSVTIRPLTSEDRSHWARLWQSYLAFYNTRLPDEVYGATFVALLSDAPDSPSGLIAHQDGHPVGLVHYLFHAHCWKPAGICYLQDLYVDTPARGTGAGRALIEAVYAVADARGVPDVYWMTQEFNHTARQLYDRVGQVTPFIKYTRAA